MVRQAHHERIKSHTYYSSKLRTKGPRLAYPPKLGIGAKAGSKGASKKLRFIEILN